MFIKKHYTRTSFLRKTYNNLFCIWSFSYYCAIISPCLYLLSLNIILNIGVYCRMIYSSPFFLFQQHPQACSSVIGNNTLMSDLRKCENYRDKQPEIDFLTAQRLQQALLQQHEQRREEVSSLEKCSQYSKHHLEIFSQLGLSIFRNTTHLRVAIHMISTRFQ